MGTDDRDESRELRGRIEQLERLLESLESLDLVGGRAIAAKTVNLGSYPGSGAVGKTFAVVFQDVTGAETEGASATVTDRSGHHFAVNLASGLPPANTEIIVYEVPYAFVFRYSG